MSGEARNFPMELQAQNDTNLNSTESSAAFRILSRVNYDNYLPRGLAVRKQARRTEKNNENVREYVWIIAFMKQSMVLRPQRGRQSHTTHRAVIACWQRAECSLCFIIFLCYQKLCHRHWNLLEFIWTRTRMKRRQRQEPNFYSSDVYNAFPLRQMEFRFMDCDLRRFYDFRLAIFFSGRTEIISVNFMTDIGHISDEKLRDVSFMKFFVIASAAENCTRRRTSPRMCRRGVFLLACFPSSFSWEAKDEELSHATLNLSLTA